MSEKRFTVISEKIGRFHNIFVQTDKIEYLLTGDFDNDSEMIKEIGDLLNEQQATIKQLQRKCFELEKDYVIETSDVSDKIYLEDEIKKLKKEYGVIDDE